jgi:DNA ligase-1
MIGVSRFNGFDGELVVGPKNAPDVYNKTSSGVMAKNGQPDFDFFAFDCYLAPDLPHRVRMNKVHTAIRVDAYPSPFYVPMLKTLDQTVINDLFELDLYEAHCIEEGFEGVMLRSPDSPYKFGRSTVKEGHLLKVKRFAHDEATIIGFEELMHNGNEATTNELGRTKRSTAKDGLVPAGMMGAYIVKHPDYEKPFNVSCGSMSKIERKARWDLREFDIGKLCRYKHLPHGAKDVPRHPLFAGFRSPDDLS